MRTILLYKKGATSHVDLRTIDGIEHPNFKEACEALGFLDDDTELDKCLTEAASFQTGSGELRELFATILCTSLPTNCRALYEKHKYNLAEDILQNIRINNNNYDIVLNDDMLDLSLHLLNVELLKMGKSAKDFDLPAYDLPQNIYNRIDANRLIRD